MGDLLQIQYYKPKGRPPFSDELMRYALGAAAPGFNSLIPAPSVPSLISTEPVELLCRTSNISSTDPFCFVNQKQETVEAFLQFIYKCAQLRPACAEQKFTAIKATTQP